MKGRTMVTVAAISVVVLGLGAAAIGAWAHGAGGPGPHGWMMKRMVSSMLDEALDKANVSAEQRAAVHASRDRAFAAFDAQRPDHDTQREQILSMFEADRVDPAQLETLHARMEEHRTAMRTAVTQAIIEIHDTLTPEQRKIVAQFVRDHRPGGPGHWR